MLKKTFYTTMIMACGLSQAPCGFSMDMENFPTVLWKKIFEQAIVPNDQYTPLDLEAYKSIDETCKKWHDILGNDLLQGNPLVHKRMLEHSFQYLKKGPTNEITQLAEHFSPEAFLTLFLSYEGDKDVLDQYFKKTIELLSFDKLKEKKLFGKTIGYFKLKSRISIDQSCDCALAYEVDNSSKTMGIFKRNVNNNYYLTGVGFCSIVDAFTYEGGFLEGRFHGKGIMTFSTGDKYEGEFVEGKRHGKGVFDYANKDKYEGFFVDNKFQGKGILTFANGDIYEGEFVKGALYGKGIMNHCNGDKYEGDFVEGECHGKGIFTHVDGHRYKGDFVKGKYHGKGSFTYGLTKYKGDFVDGLYHGNGTLRSSSIRDLSINTSSIGFAREKYEGAFFEGKKTGKGVRTKEEGLFFERTIIEQKIIERYEGFLVDDIPNGQGIWVYADGRKYEGNFLDGKLHGKGIRTYINGIKYEGVFAHGEVEEKAVYNTYVTDFLVYDNGETTKY